MSEVGGINGGPKRPSQTGSSRRLSQTQINEIHAQKKNANEVAAESPAERKMVDNFTKKVATQMDPNQLQSDQLEQSIKNQKINLQAMR